MPASNVFQIGIALQATKGQSITTPQRMIDVSAADLRPVVASERREETGQGVDVGGSYVSNISVTGGFTCLLRPSFAPLLNYGILGSRATTGAGPYEHAATAANTKPYFTFWRSLGGIIWEKFSDCHITGANFSWEPGGELSVAYSVVGLGYARLTTAFTLGTYDATETPFRVPGRVLTIDSTIQGNVTSGNLNIEWPSTAIQTGAITNTYLEPGARTISGSWTEIVENVARYAQVITGTTTGTTATEVLHEGPIAFEFPHEDAHTLTLAAPRFKFTEVTANPSTGSDPLLMPVAGTVEKPSSGSILTLTTENDVAAYAAAA
jgi:hypothetical protein